MLSQIPRESQAYADLYHGRTIVLKVSGAEIAGEHFPALVDDIQDLARRGVRIVLTFGGGEQISQAYGKPRQKIDGVGITDDDVMRQGVLPAYQMLRQQIQGHLKTARFVEPADLRCDRTNDGRLGHVGVPRELVLPDDEIAVVGFVGTAEGREVNVNADDVAMQIARQAREEIEELILLTGTGGVLDRKGNVVSLLTDAKIDEILEGQSPQISVEGGMLKKMQAVRDAIAVVDKAVITRTDRLESELLNWMGDGTMCVNTSRLASSPMQKREEGIFRAVYDQYVKAGTFRERPQDELERLARNHHVLRIKNSPLGGFSLVPSGQWTELSALWAGTIGNGIGSRVMDAAILETGKRPMYALSAQPDAISALQRHGGFTDKGPLSDAKGSPGIPEHLQNYDTSLRNPNLFIVKNTRA